MSKLTIGAVRITGSPASGVNNMANIAIDTMGPLRGPAGNVNRHRW